MGSRANYIAIEHGKRDIYYSHWGALSVPGVVIGGPTETLAYIRGLAPADQLLDTVWAEGGILLDADTQTLIFWGGNALYRRPYLRHVLLPALRLIWPGWAVSWAARSTVDFADYLGLDADAVSRREATFVWDPYSEEELRAGTEQSCSTAVTVQWGNATITDHILPLYHRRVMTFGPRLLDILRERGPQPLPREDGDEPPAGGAFADIGAQTLWVWSGSTLESAHMARIEQAWPGWRVEGHVDGLARQLVLSGRDPALVTPPLAQIVDELVAELAGDDDFDPTPFGKALLANLEGLDGAVQIAPGFFRMDRPPTTTAERRELLTRLFSSVAQDLNDSDR